MSAASSHTLSENPDLSLRPAPEAGGDVAWRLGRRGLFAGVASALAAAAKAAATPPSPVSAVGDADLSALLTKLGGLPEVV